MMRPSRLGTTLELLCGTHHRGRQKKAV
ncbi:unnamed protein product [Ectocarpus sp. CCAP 1310/34]|nr:unnamed protein product [Ectocarpus sp. CCAP 1310/34]